MPTKFGFDGRRSATVDHGDHAAAKATAGHACATEAMRFAIDEMIEMIHERIDLRNADLEVVAQRAV